MEVVFRIKDATAAAVVQEISLLVIRSASNPASLLKVGRNDISGTRLPATLPAIKEKGRCERRALLKLPANSYWATRRMAWL